MEKEPNHSENNNNKWDELTENPNSEEMSRAEQIDIVVSDKETTDERDELMQKIENDKGDDLEHESEKDEKDKLSKKIGEHFRRKMEEAPERAKEQVDLVKTLSQGFYNRCEAIKKEGGKMSEKEFLRWEEGYAMQWEFLQNYLADGQINTMKEEADIEFSLFVTDNTASESIEAQAGHFFDDRAKMLKRAIESSDDPNKEKDLNDVSTFLEVVFKHLDYRYKGGSDFNRTLAHNNVIKRLNRLNDLAEKYDTTRFTPRNFWTSENKDQSQGMINRMRYDRAAVEAYYTNAFGDVIEFYEKEHSNW